MPDSKFLPGDEVLVGPNSKWARVERRVRDLDPRRRDIQVYLVRDSRGVVYSASDVVMALTTSQLLVNRCLHGRQVY